MAEENKPKSKKNAEVELLRSFLYNYVYPTCTFFTISIFVVNIIGTLANQSQIVPTLSFMGLLLLFSIAIACANRVLKSSLSGMVKFVIHFIVCTAAFVLVFVVFSGYYRRGSSAVFIVFFFVLAYAIIMSVGALIKGAFKAKKIEETPYKRQF